MLQRNFQYHVFFKLNTIQTQRVKVVGYNANKPAKGRPLASSAKQSMSEK